MWTVQPRFTSHRYARLPWFVPTHGSRNNLRRIVLAMRPRGVTRATRIAKLSPGTLIWIEVVGDLAAAVGHLPTIGELLP